MIMKKIIAIIGVVTLVLVSCKKDKPEEIIPSTVESAKIEESVGKQCFQSITNKDTIVLTLNTNSHNEVDGQLTYKIYEKDKNEGTIIIGKTKYAKIENGFSSKNTKRLPSI
jgi:hypothetical protein